MTTVADPTVYGIRLIASQRIAAGQIVRTDHAVIVSTAPLTNRELAAAEIRYAVRKALLERSPWIRLPLGPEPCREPGSRLLEQARELPEDQVAALLGIPRPVVRVFDATNALCLDSRHLFDAAGFNNGREPEPWLDHLDKASTRYPSRHEWNRVLARLVWRRLIPVLPAQVDVDLHDTRLSNPIRAQRVDGIPVTWSPAGEGRGHYFEPVTVWVPWADVTAELESIR